MANCPTITLRLFPKNGRISDKEANEICQFIASNAVELDYEVIYYCDFENNCIDIKFKCRRGFHKFDSPKLNSNKYFIWKINSWDYDGLNFMDGDIRKSEKAAYNFDSVSLIGNHSHLNEFKNDLVSKEHQAWKSEWEEIVSENERTIQTKGIYYASNGYTIGTQHSLIPKKLDLANFIKLREDGMIDSIKNIEKIDKEAFHVLLDFMHDYEEIEENFEGFRFYNNNRVVKEIVKGKKFTVSYHESEGNTFEKRGWIMRSADYWDNLANPFYLKFFKEYKDKLSKLK